MPSLRVHTHISYVIHRYNIIIAYAEVRAWVRVHVREGKHVHACECSCERGTCVCVCVCIRSYVRACVRACVRAYVRACVCGRARAGGIHNRLNKITFS